MLYTSYTGNLYIHELYNVYFANSRILNVHFVSDLRFSYNRLWYWDSVDRSIISVHRYVDIIHQIVILLRLFIRENYVSDKSTIYFYNRCRLLMLLYHDILLCTTHAYINTHVCSNNTSSVCMHIMLAHIDKYMYMKIYIVTYRIAKIHMMQKYGKIDILQTRNPSIP